MRIEKKSKVIDISVSVFIMIITVATICNNKFSGMIDAFFLPEERNKGYYKYISRPLELSESKELYENGTKNLLANYMKSGNRGVGYSITVNPDGTFLFSGNYSGKNDIHEDITPKGVGFFLPSGDYVLSDGGASSEDNVYLKITGWKRMADGSIEYSHIANLPNEVSFHYERDPETALYCEIAIRPGTSLEETKFSPMLLRAEDAVNQKYQPCITPYYDWGNDEAEEEVRSYKYYIDKNDLNGETITKDDWKIFLNRLKTEMQADRAVIDLRDGYGIDIRKNEYPVATYGRFNISLYVSELKTLNITDYDEVMKVINSNAE